MPPDELPVTFSVNGEKMTRRVSVRIHLADFLRNELELTGTHLGCEHGVCGACTVRMDGDIVRACLVLAVQCDGARIETIEGVSESGEIADLQREFHERNALHCGFCTPAMLLTAADLLKSDPAPGREKVRAFLSGNYCRCTGYHAIVDAVEATAAERRRVAGLSP